jgi:hypothetical protein
MSIEDLVTIGRGKPKYGAGIASALLFYVYIITGFMIELQRRNERFERSLVQCSVLEPATLRFLPLLLRFPTIPLYQWFLTWGNYPEA